jgi:RepB DNA-primase from phage plasmid
MLEKTYEAVYSQMTAMGAELFEVGALRLDAGGMPDFMLLRSWDRKTVMDSIPWLWHQNWRGSHIYVRPKGENNLTLIDDLKYDALAQLRRAGLQPAAVVRTSPGNYQAWIKHTAQLDKELGTAVARDLAERFGGDVKATDWRHFGRLSGFRNTKAKHKEVVPVPEYDEWRSRNFHRDLEGQWVDKDGGVHTEGQLREMHARLLPATRYPFVRLLEAPGVVARDSERVVASAKTRLEQESMERARVQAEFRMRAQRQSAESIKGIEQFREDARYGRDGTRVDLAYAVYALAHGADLATVEAALRSRDLSHKGNEKRQRDYIQRTVRKAIVSLESGRER